MAYDLIQIAPERNVPPFKPSWLPWAVLFVVIVGGGAFCVIRFWPIGEASNTPWFWTCVIAFPSIAWLAAFCIYLGVLQAPIRRAIDYNNARRIYLDGVYQKASVPLHILGSAFIFSAHEHENIAEQVAQQRLTLELQSRFESDSEAILARWIAPDGYAWLPNGDHADVDRHREILPYVFDVLLRQIAPAVRALPNRTRLTVRLAVATLLPIAEVDAVWHDTWVALKLPDTEKPELDVTAPELIGVDQWLDGKGIAEPNAANLLCVVQLNALLNTAPEVGSTEAGVIMLFASSALASQKQLTTETFLSRPELRDEKGIAQGLRQAMLWGGVQKAALKDQWMTGGTRSPLNRALASELDAQAVGVARGDGLNGQHDVDFRLGSAGIATPWLCVSLAAQHARNTHRKQLVSIAQGEQLTLSVVASRY